MVRRLCDYAGAAAEQCCLVAGNDEYTTGNRAPGDAFRELLRLYRMENNLATAAPNTVRDMRWRLEVSAPLDALTTSLDAFTIRGDQANRDDLALLRWSASGSVGQ
jgi:hypothetical protein